jgi:limonene-1,2-epoxide hydrolase
MPTVRGRERVRKLFQALLRIGTEVEMHVHAISADGPTAAATGRFRLVALLQLRHSMEPTAAKASAATGATAKSHA